MKTCSRERCPPTAVLKAMLAKGSVKFGLGMQLGRMEGAKEARASPRTPHRLAPHIAPRPSAPPHPISSAAQTSPHTVAALPGSKAPRRLATRAPRATHSAGPTHPAASCLRRRAWDRSRCRESSRELSGAWMQASPRQGLDWSTEVHFANRRAASASKY